MEKDYPNLETMLIDEIISQDESLQDLFGAMGETVGDFFELCEAVTQALRNNDAVRELALNYMIARACRYWMANQYCGRKIKADLPEYGGDRFAKSREILEWAQRHAAEVTAKPKSGND